MCLHALHCNPTSKVLRQPETSTQVKKCFSDARVPYTVTFSDLLTSEGALLIFKPFLYKPIVATLLLHKSRKKL